MGGNNSKKDSSFGIKENNYIFQLLSSMNWRERSFRIFCFRFEYKFYSNKSSDPLKTRYTIKWNEFDKFMLNNFFELEKDTTHYLIHCTFRNFFALHNDEVKIYRIFMMYFPYLQHLPEMQGLDFIDLIFEKIIYNLEVEIKIKKLLSEVVEKDKDKNFEKQKNNEGNLNLKNILKNNDFIEEISYDDKTNRNLLLNKTANQSISHKNDPVDKINFDNNCDDKLLEFFSEYTINRGTNESNIKDDECNFVRKIPMKVFKEIMYIFFQNNVTLLLRMFREVIKEWDERDFENEGFIKKMKKLKYQNVSVEKMTSENVYKFIDITLKKLVAKRANLSKKKDVAMMDLELTFDDIYVYLKLNSYFLNSNQLFEEFRRVM